MKRFAISKKWVFFVFALSFLIRLVALDQSLWLDEGTTARVVSEYGLRQIVTDFAPADFHPPFYYLIMKIWTTIAGRSEIALRFPSIIFSLAAGWGVFLLGGFWPSLFFLFNPLVIYYSQEARMYMLVVFILTFALYFLNNLTSMEKSKIQDAKSKIQKNHPKSKIDLLFFNIAVILSFYTFYGSIFLIIPFLLFLFYKNRYNYFPISILVFAVSLIIIFPLFHQQLLHSHMALVKVANWKQVLGPPTLKNLSLIPLKFSVGRINFSPKIVYYLLSGFWSSIVFGLLIKGGLKNKQLLFFFLSPIFLAFLFSFAMPLLQYFRFLYLIPLMNLLLSHALPAPKNLTKPAIAVIFGVLSLIYLLNPQFHREDWKSLAHSLPPEKTIYMVPSAADALRYYKNDISIADLRHPPSNAGNIIVIPYVSEIHGVKYKSLLEAKGYIKRNVESFREIQVESWTKL